VEKVIRAFTLLEGLRLVNIDFIFKGGTALMLLIPEIKRLSIDIDIILPENLSNIDQLFERIVIEKGFLRYEKKERKTKSKIEKAHYKFYYSPVTNTRAKEEYILLDILFQENPYGNLVKETEIKSPFIIIDGQSVNVMTPSAEAILGDKLTAYAPNTTGVRYNEEKEIEIIKQLYDIGNLFQIINDISLIKTVFGVIGKKELEYRELISLSQEDILDDIYQTSLCLSLQGKDGIGNFTELQKGVQNIVNFIISEKFHLEKAIISASKAAYLSVLIRKEVMDIKRYKSPDEIKDMLIQQPFNTKLNKLKKSNPQAFFYWYHATSLL
ncbi:MAG TPA: nucleotidyl transferase AbiEii/AbiGii toxin family protein, partial [Bacteroidia bacterium]|nr:nucleotidyl transferase AbiEii/AbiGii toxin family protein [Bacteroidia bacterium]